MTEVGTNTRGSGNLPLHSLAYTAATAILVAFGLYAVFVVGPAMRASAHESIVQMIADEDHQVCGMLGMRSGTDAFVACSRELSIVRQRQIDRDNAAAEGIL